VFLVGGTLSSIADIRFSNSSTINNYNIGNYFDNFV